MGRKKGAAAFAFAEAPAAKGPAFGVGLVYCEEDAQHALRDGLGREREHCEKPERTQLVWDRLMKSGLAERCERVPVREATRDEALRCHTAEVSIANGAPREPALS